MGLVIALWTAVRVLFYSGTCLAAAWHVPRRTIAIGLGVAAASLVRETLMLGQINLVLIGLVALDCLLPKPPWPRGMLIVSPPRSS
ncbi:glycosyltransferase 87 family protein [Lentzea tibetensis]|uniref:glycosyltransferase 87 family protein n=1 Tax=Lentzea tibetensis TaxID=2591470 RepID=UPI0016458779|nr:glycosyltransferase 87 family protein [Lentzea tibetensis]